MNFLVPQNTTSKAINAAFKYLRSDAVRTTAINNDLISKKLFNDIDVPANEIHEAWMNTPVLFDSEFLPPPTYGTYQGRWPQKITVSVFADENIQEPVIFHEMLHHARYGEAQQKLQKIKAKSLFPDSEYLNLPGEAAANSATLGHILGLSPGQKYPGYETFKKDIEKYKEAPFSGILEEAKLVTKRDYKRLWDAITGKYFSIPVIGLGSTILNNEFNKNTR